MKFNKCIWSQWRKGIVFVNIQLNLCFVKVSKNAGTSLYNIFNTKKESRFDSCDGMLRFTVIRNPMERIVSSYIEILKLRRDGNYRYTVSLPFYNIVDPIVRFSQFLDDIKDNIYDTHIMPQTFQMYRQNEIDHFIIFEDLHNEINLFAKKYNVKHGPIIHINRNINNGLKERLTDDIKGDIRLQLKIRDIYKDDFDLYDKVLRNRKNEKV